MRLTAEGASLLAAFLLIVLLALLSVILHRYAYSFQATESVAQAETTKAEKPVPICTPANNGLVISPITP